MEKTRRKKREKGPCACGAEQHRGTTEGLVGAMHTGPVLIGRSMPLFLVSQRIAVMGPRKRGVFAQFWKKYIEMNVIHENLCYQRDVWRRRSRGGASDRSKNGLLRRRAALLQNSTNTKATSQIPVLKKSDSYLRSLITHFIEIR